MIGALKSAWTSNDPMTTLNLRHPRQFPPDPATSPEAHAGPIEPDAGTPRQLPDPAVRPSGGRDAGDGDRRGDHIMTIARAVADRPRARPEYRRESRGTYLVAASGGSDVQALYEAYPYPSPLVGDSLIDDVASSLHFLYGETTLDGRRILDAGCGTGQRLLAVARAFPHATCVGVDMTVASLDIARRLADRHRLTNVRFERADLLDLHLVECFDLIVSTGVIHHLADPAAGLRQLVSRLADDGVILLWCYHALGEHQRLLDRETLLTLWDRATGLERGVQLMHELGLQVAPNQYGRASARQARELQTVNLDVDAYLHPIVHAFRFADAIDLMRGSGLDWAAVNSITRPRDNALVDLEDAETSEDAKYFCRRGSSLFDREPVAAAFSRLGRLDKLRVFELQLQPNGFSILGGRGHSYRRLGPRIEGNVVRVAGD
jgi:SAM-dependent methyltransferase